MMTDASAREEAVLSAVEARREHVNDAIVEELPIKRPERLYEASRYLLDAGGKRLRPTVLLAVGEALTDVDGLGDDADFREFDDLDGNAVDLMAAAVSVEVIQSFTLIHDDIMDDDELRRGVPAVHEEFGLDTAILAGDTLYSKAFEILTETGAPADRSVEAMHLLASTCTKICEGQSLDVAFEQRGDVVPEEYMEMIEHKTAVLYAASAAMAGILLGADERTVDELYGYGLDVGRAFQIWDDVLDLTTPSETLGKQRGSDLVEDKQTLITVHAREHDVDVDALVETDDVDAVTEAEIDAAVDRLNEAGSIEYATETARDLVAQGKARLQRLPENDARALLEDLADYLIEREY
jgi:geranylgeranyl diphosphate synthase type I